MGEVVKFLCADAAKDPDVVLEGAIGDYEEVLILGWGRDGLLDARGTLGLSQKDILWLIEFFKHKLMAGDYSG